VPKSPHEVGCRNENLFVILRKEEGGFSTSRPYLLNCTIPFRLAAMMVDLFIPPNVQRAA
jgi:hypothetical protein